MRYKVGDKIWVGEFSSMAPVYETCPDCGGTGRLRVTFHDEAQVSIECQNCAAGYDPPTGRVIVYKQVASARHAAISGLEVDGDKVRWHVDSHSGSYRIIDDDKAFDTEAEAVAWAQCRSAEYEQEQRDRIFKKEKDTRKWAWNASYHRNCIKRAQKDLEYHTAKLNVAKVKAKEPEPALT